VDQDGSDHRLRNRHPVSRGERFVRLGMWDAAISTLTRAIEQDRVEFRSY